MNPCSQAAALVLAITARGQFIAGNWSYMASSARATGKMG